MTDAVFDEISSAKHIGHAAIDFGIKGIMTDQFSPGRTYRPASGDVGIELPADFDARPLESSDDAEQVVPASVIRDRITVLEQDIGGELSPAVVQPQPTSVELETEAGSM